MDTHFSNPRVFIKYTLNKHEIEGSGVPWSRGEEEEWE